MLFFRFMFCLAVGLTGLCAVLMTVMETLFADWDPVADMRVMMEKPSLLKRVWNQHQDEARQRYESLSTRMPQYQHNVKLPKALIEAETAEVAFPS